jgi:hypothetical protein
MAHPRWARTSSGGGAQVGQQLGLAGEHGGEDRAGHGEQLRDLRGFPPLSQESPSCTVAVVALPLALAFGVSSGLGAQAGLVTAVVARVAGRRVRREQPAGVRADRGDDGGPHGQR